MQFFKNISQYDMHAKHLERVTQQTILGAVMTIFACIIVFLLFFNEVSSYSSEKLVTRMIADNSVGRGDESIRLHFDIDFMNVPCGRINFAQEVVRGQVHQHLENKVDDIKKEVKSYTGENGSVGAPGCWIHGSMVTDKIAGNIVFKVTPDPPKLNSHITGKSPPAAGVGGNTAAEQVRFMQMQMGMPPIPDLPSMSHRVNHIMMFPYESDSASDGNENPSLSKYQLDSRDPVDNTRLRPDILAYHIGQTGLLSNHTTNLAKEIGIHHYGIQVIPSQVHASQKNGRPIDGDVYQYSVTQRSLETMMVLDGTIQLSGQSFTDLFGVIFTYDFYPIKIITEDHSDYFIDFLANLFGIIGGVITVIGLMERCLAQSSKAVMGKKD
jgi:hypothetical protein